MPRQATSADTFQCAKLIQSQFGFSPHGSEASLRLFMRVFISNCDWISRERNGDVQRKMQRMLGESEICQAPPDTPPGRTRSSAWQTAAVCQTKNKICIAVNRGLGLCNKMSCAGASVRLGMHRSYPAVCFASVSEQYSHTRVAKPSLCSRNALYRTFRGRHRAPLLEVQSV